MRVRVPDYFDGFSCLAGACPHSCCIGWEVVLDEDTVRRYQQLPGALGERLRDCLLYTSPSPRDLVSSRMPSSA